MKYFLVRMLEKIQRFEHWSRIFGSTMYSLINNQININQHKCDHGYSSRIARHLRKYKDLVTITYASISLTSLFVNIIRPKNPF